MAVNLPLIRPRIQTTEGGFAGSHWRLRQAGRRGRPQSAQIVNVSGIAAEPQRVVAILQGRGGRVKGGRRIK